MSKRAGDDALDNGDDTSPPLPPSTLLPSPALARKRRVNRSADLESEAAEQAVELAAHEARQARLEQSAAEAVARALHGPPPLTLSGLPLAEAATTTASANNDGFAVPKAPPVRVASRAAVALPPARGGGSGDDDGGGGSSTPRLLRRRASLTSSDESSSVSSALSSSQLTENEDDEELNGSFAASEPPADRSVSVQRATRGKASALQRHQYRERFFVLPRPAGSSSNTEAGARPTGFQIVSLPVASGSASSSSSSSSSALTVASSSSSLSSSSPSSSPSSLPSSSSSSSTSTSTALFLSGAQLPLCELQRMSLEWNSWFNGNSVVSDGSLFVATPVDPLFLLLPLLETARGKTAERDGYFVDFDTVISTAALHPAAATVLHSIDTSVLRPICDVQQSETLGTAYRLNDARLVCWLRLKLQRVAAYLKVHDPTVARKAAATIALVDTAPPTDEDLRRAALGIMSEYVSSAWIERLATAEGLDALNSKPGAAAYFRPETFTRSFGGSQLAAPVTPPKPKLTPAQKRLETEGAKKGTQSIMSFFGKKKE